MENIFGKSDIFATPESIEALQDYADRLSGGERAVAYVIMGMTWNLAHELLAAELRKARGE